MSDETQKTVQSENATETASTDSQDKVAEVVEENYLCTTAPALRLDLPNHLGGGYIHFENGRFQTSDPAIIEWLDNLRAKKSAIGTLINKFNRRQAAEFANKVAAEKARQNRFIKGSTTTAAGVGETPASAQRHQLAPEDQRELQNFDNAILQVGETAEVYRDSMDGFIPEQPKDNGNADADSAAQPPQPVSDEKTGISLVNAMLSGGKK